MSGGENLLEEATSSYFEALSDEALCEENESWQKLSLGNSREWTSIWTTFDQD